MPSATLFRKPHTHTYIFAPWMSDRLAILTTSTPLTSKQLRNLVHHPDECGKISLVMIEPCGSAYVDRRNITGHQLCSAPPNTTFPQFSGNVVFCGMLSTMLHTKSPIIQPKHITYEELSKVEWAQKITGFY